MLEHEEEIKINNVISVLANSILNPKHVFASHYTEKSFFAPVISPRVLEKQSKYDIL